MTRSLLSLSLLLAALASETTAQTVELYENDFETPNVPLVKACGNAIDTREINFLYGGTQGTFQQTFTVEAVLLDDPVYSDPSGTGGTAAIGMVRDLEADLLALTFDTEGRAFLNVVMDLTSIDVEGCGGPFGVAAPVYRLTLVDSPGGAFSFGSGTVLDTRDVAGVEAPDGFTTEWARRGAALDASASTDGTVTLVWDLIQSGYAAFDNLVITADDDPVSGEQASGVPSVLGLSPGSPNPFRPATAFTLDVPRPGVVTVAVFDALGRRVAVLHDGDLPAGTHALDFDAGSLPGGVYVVRAVGAGQAQARTVTRLR